MVIVDTNVISEPMNKHPSAAVTNWLGAQDHGTLYLTTVNVAELFFGIEILVDCKRMRSSLTKMLLLPSKQSSG